MDNSNKNGAPRSTNNANSYYINEPQLPKPGYGEALISRILSAEQDGLKEQRIEDAHSNTGTLVLEGLAQANSRVYLYDNGTFIGSAIVTSQGRWVWSSSTPLIQGEHHLTVKVAGFANASPAITVTVGDVTPEVPVDPVDPEHPIDPITPVDPVKPVPPAAIKLTHVYDDRNGLAELQNGAVTKDISPVFTGTAEKNSLVNVYSSYGALLARLQADANGEWTYTASLYSGSHTLRFGTSYESASESFTVNIPNVIRIDRGIDDSKHYQDFGQDATINDSTPTLYGYASQAGTLYVFDNGVLIGSTYAYSAGPFHYTPANGLSNGEHSLVFSSKAYWQADSAYNSDAFTFTVAPAAIVPVTIEQAYTDQYGYEAISSGAVSKDTTPVFNGKAEKFSWIYVYNNGQQIGQIASDSNGSWQYRPNLQPGEYNLSFGTSAANISTPFALTIVSNITIESALDDRQGWDYFSQGAVTDDNQPTLYGYTSQAGHIYVYDNGTLVGSFYQRYSGRFEFTPSAELGEGRHSLVFSNSAVWKAGSPLNAEAFDFTVQTVAVQPPVIEPVDPVDPIDPVDPVTPVIASVGDRWADFTGLETQHGNAVRDERPDIFGQAAPGSKVGIYDNGELIAEVIANASGVWSLEDVDFADGKYQLVAKVDGVSSEPFSFEVAAQNIAISAIVNSAFPDDYATDGGNLSEFNNVVVYGFGGTPDATVEVKTTDGRIIGYTGVGEDGRWYFESETFLRDGAYQLVVKMGNQTSEPFTITVGDVVASVEEVAQVSDLTDLTAADLLNEASFTLLDQDENIVANAPVAAPTQWVSHSENLAQLIDEPASNGNVF